MAKKVILPSYTVFIRNEPNFDLITYYRDCDAQEILQILIAKSATTFNGVALIEGELLISGDENFFGNQIDFDINSLGDLVAIGSSSNEYSVNNEGELIWDTDKCG